MGDILWIFERVRGGTTISKMSTFLTFPKFKLDQTVGIAVGHRSGGQLATTFVANILVIIFFFPNFLQRRSTLIKIPIWPNLTGAPQAKGVDRFKAPSAILRHPGGHFGFVRFS